LFGLPFLVLYQGTAHASRVTTTPLAALRTDRNVVDPASHLDGTSLSSHLVAYQTPQSTTTTAPPVTTTIAAVPATPTTTTTTEPPPPPPPTTTTTAAPPPAPTESEGGDATWYSEAAPGMCASPTLPFGTVLTVTDDATGARTQCTVDDREGAGYPRVVDMSYSGFSQIADPSQGVVEVTISW
jgi:rare lipoprotein A (peptidoglycan hydrolase)